MEAVEVEDKSWVCVKYFANTVSSTFTYHRTVPSVSDINVEISLP